MVELTMKNKICVSEIKEVEVVYNLISNEGLYGIECYIDGADQKSSMEYFKIDELTKNRQKAVDFLNKLYHGEVFPIHVRDIVEDIFYC